MQVMLKGRYVRIENGLRFYTQRIGVFKVYPEMIVEGSCFGGEDAAGLLGVEAASRRLN